MNAVRVLVIDDSALACRLLSAMLACDPAIEVVGTAGDPLIAREMIKQLAPDVLTLDVEMPRMDGLTFLQNLMRLRPMPVVMVSSLTRAGAEVTLRALALGAVDFFAKPHGDLTACFAEAAQELCAKVHAAARSQPRRASTSSPAAPPVVGAVSARPRNNRTIIALGASTGGTEAILTVLQAMPFDAPPVLIAQHIPAAFSGAFAERMDRLSAMRVCQAHDGQPVQAGHAYIAPGGEHLLAQWDGRQYVCHLHNGLPVNRHKPSVDVLFRSLLACAGPATVAALLTGMGEDGARGLLELRQAGARTLVQDQASSVVWGMPGAAWKLGAAAEALPLDRLAARLLALACQPLEPPATHVRPGTCVSC